MSQTVDHEKVALARRLAEEGHDAESITDIVGVSRQTLYRWGIKPTGRPRSCVWCGEEFRSTDGRRKLCSDECAHAHENARKRRCDDRHRGRCADCGRALGSGSAWKGAVHCPDCHAAHVRSRVEERWDRIEVLWSEGLLVREIADRLGTSAASIGVEINAMRRAGRSVPYRLRGYDLFPDQISEAV